MKRVLILYAQDCEFPFETPHFDYPNLEIDVCQTGVGPYSTLTIVNTLLTTIQCHGNIYDYIVNIGFAGASVNDKSEAKDLIGKLFQVRSSSYYSYADFLEPDICKNCVCPLNDIPVADCFSHYEFVTEPVALSKTSGYNKVPTPVFLYDMELASILFSCESHLHNSPKVISLKVVTDCLDLEQYQDSVIDGTFESAIQQAYEKVLSLLNSVSF